MKLMTKINRISAWILMVCFILFAVTGLDIQSRVLIPQESSLIHFRYLFLPAQTVFTLHSSFEIYLALKRWNWWNNAGKTIMTIYVLMNLGLIAFYVSTFF